MPVILTDVLKPDQDLYKNLDKILPKTNKKVVVYISDQCQQTPICNKQMLLQKLSMLNISSGDVVFENVNKDVDVYLPAIFIPKGIAEKISKSNPQIQQVLTMYFKKI